MILDSKIEYLEARGKHVCSICGCEFFWNDDSHWYGVLENRFSESTILEKCCSTNCKSKSKFKGEMNDNTF